MITAAESLAHIVISAGVSTAMIGRGFVARAVRAGDCKRRVRRLWLVAGALGAAMSCGVALADSNDGRGLNTDRIISTLVVLALGTLVASSLANVGLRGRRVGDHPHCRRCGFDLFGTPVASRLCNECGASLDAPRAVVIGVRHRRIVPLLVGVFAGIVVLAYATSLAPEVIHWSSSADFESLKPDAWVLDDLYSRNATMRGRASNELSRRATAGTIGRATVNRLVTRLLAEPMPGTRMPDVSEEATFAAFIAEQAWRHDTADEADVRRAMGAGLACTLHVAPQASADRTLRFWIAAADYRIARADQDDPAFARLTVTDRADALDGAPLPASTWSTLRAADEWPGLEPFGNAFDLRGYTRLGAATLTSRFTATLTLAMPGRPTLIESRDFVLTGTTSLVAASAMTCPTINATTQPSLPVLRIIRSDRGRELAVQAPPEGALLADVVLHDAGAARTLGTIFAEANNEATVPIEVKPPDAYEIELRPAPERGADLFAPVPVLTMPTTLQSSAIEDDR